MFLRLNRISRILLAAALWPISASADSLELLPQVPVDSQGVFLDQILGAQKTANGIQIPHVQISPAPGWGESRSMNRKDVAEAIMKFVPSLGSETLSGASEVRITRRARQLEEKELGKLLMEKLQTSSSSDRNGELDLRLVQWKPVLIPIEPIDLRIISQPSSGITSRFSLRFEVKSGDESVGVFTAFVEAHLFREVWVARSLVKRGTTLDAADLARERRDVLNNMRDPPWSGQELAPHFHTTYDIAAGAILSDRAVKARPILQRGDYAQAVAVDGLLTVSMKVEVLENGTPGQTIKVRNLRTKKELRGKVIDEATIQIVF